MNTAQQVRIWVSLGLAVLLALSIFGMVGSLTSVTLDNGKTGLFTTDATGFYTFFAFTLVLMLADGVLAGISIFRWYHPLPKQQVPPQLVPPQPLAPAGSQPQPLAPAGSQPTSETPTPVGYDSGYR